MTASSGWGQRYLGASHGKPGPWYKRHQHVSSPWRLGSSRGPAAAVHFQPRVSALVAMETCGSTQRLHRLYSSQADIGYCKPDCVMIEKS